MDLMLAVPGAIAIGLSLGLLGSPSRETPLSNRLDLGLRQRKRDRKIDLVRVDLVDVGGVELSVAKAGPEDGPLVVLLHGFRRLLPPY